MRNCFNWVKTDLVMCIGTIDVDEMVEIVGNLYELEGVSKVSLMCRTMIRLQQLRCLNYKSN